MKNMFPIRTATSIELSIHKVVYRLTWSDFAEVMAWRKLVNKMSA